MYPPVPMITRQNRPEYNFLNPFITNLIISIFEVGRDPNYWPKALKFIPERWLEDQENLEELGLAPKGEGANGKDKDADYEIMNGMKKNAFSWMPFSAGARNCIGQRFALMEIKVAIAYLFKFFHVENTVSWEYLEENLMSDIILRPKDNLMVKLRLREEYV